MSLQSIIEDIKTANTPGENTALRVGTAFEQMDSAKRDKTDSLSKSETIDMVNSVKLLAATGTPFLGTIEPSTTIPAGNFWAFASEGTYANAGGIVVGPGEIAIITRVGTTFDSVILDVPVKSIEDIEKTSTAGLVDTYTITYTDGSTPTSFEVTNGESVTDWEAKSYPEKNVVIKNNSFWRVKDGETATGSDVPGISAKWIFLNDLSKDRTLHINELKNNIFDNTLYDFGQTNSTASNFIVNQFTPSTTITINRLLFNLFTNNSNVNKIQIFEFSSPNQTSVQISNILLDVNVTPVASSFGHGYFEAELGTKINLQAGKIYAFRIGNLTSAINKSALLSTYSGSTTGLSFLAFTNAVNTGTINIQYANTFYLKPLLFKLVEDIVVKGFDTRISELDVRVTALENEIDPPSPIPKKLDFVSDSNGFGHPTNNPVYKASIGNPTQIDSFTKIASTILGFDFNNLGLSSSRLASDPNSSVVSMVDRLDSIRTDADYIGIMGGTNDFTNGIPLGVLGDNISTTFYGALRIICETLIKRYWIDQNRPEVKIFFCTFPKKATSQASNIAMDFSTQLQYRNAILKTCDAFGLPVFDLWEYGQASPHTMRTYGDGSGNLFNRFMPDGTHFSVELHKNAGRLLANFIGNVL